MSAGHALSPATRGQERSKRRCLHSALQALAKDALDHLAPMLDQARFQSQVSGLNGMKVSG